LTNKAAKGKKGTIVADCMKLKLRLSAIYWKIPANTKYSFWDNTWWQQTWDWLPKNVSLQLAS
jgi:hypothetical protein